MIHKNAELWHTQGLWGQRFIDFVASYSPDSYQCLLINMNYHGQQISILILYTMCFLVFDGPSWYRPYCWPMMLCGLKMYEIFNPWDDDKTWWRWFQHIPTKNVTRIDLLFILSIMYITAFIYIYIYTYVMTCICTRNIHMWCRLL